MEAAEVHALRRALVGGERVVVAGVVLLELLQQFVPDRSQRAIRSAFDTLEFAEPDRGDYVEAAALSNTCRRRGVQLATIDSLIAALCIARGLQLLTADADFRHATRHIPLVLWPT